MSAASERKAMRQLLPEYSLLSVQQLASFLGCSDDIAREMIDDGVIPSVRVGKRRHVDPLDAVVHVLADREGVSAAEFWRAHGIATSERVRDYLAHLRKSTLLDRSVREKLTA